jgi:Tfp pilus assembly protein PilW
MQEGGMQLKGREVVHRQRGFAIIDILVATALIVVILAAVTTFNRAQLFALQNQAVQSDVQATARGIVDLMTREIRRAGGNPTCIPSFSAIADAKQSKLQILSDLDGDGTTTGINENITYEYKFAQNTFVRVANGSTQSLIENVNLSGSRIRYFNGAGVDITAGETGLSSSQRNNVRRIRVELDVSRKAADPENDMPLTVSVANNINLRNRYFVNAVACP